MHTGWYVLRCVCILLDMVLTVLYVVLPNSQSTSPSMQRNSEFRCEIWNLLILDGAPQV